MLHPSQFEPGDAWIAFRLNDEPIETIEDGSFNGIAIMDAGSCYIFGVEMVPASKGTKLPLSHARRLLQMARVKSDKYPDTLFVPKGAPQGALATEASRHGIEVIPVPAIQLLVFTGEAIASYREHMQRRGAGEPD